MWIFDYLTYQDFDFMVPQVPTIKESIDKAEDAFIITIIKEIETTDYIDKIYELAQNEKDNLTRQWLDKLLIPE
jgi:ferritin